MGTDTFWDVSGIPATRPGRGNLGKIVGTIASADEALAVAEHELGAAATAGSTRASSAPNTATTVPPATATRPEEFHEQVSPAAMRLGDDHFPETG